MFTRFLKLQIVHVIDLRAISNGFLQVRLRKYEFRSRNRAPQALASNQLPERIPAAFLIQRRSTIFAFG